MLFQIGVRSTEMPVAKEPLIGRKRRRMRRSQHKMTVTVNESPLLLRVCPPQNEDKMLVPFGQHFNGGIGELLPASALMRTGLVRPYCQSGVEEQHALLGPTGEVTAYGNRCAQVTLNFLKDILQRRRKRYPVIHGKAQAMCLAWTMIRILTDDDDFHLVEGTKIKSIEYQPSRRITRRNAIFLSHKIRQADKIVFLKFTGKLLFPAGFYLHVHTPLIYIVGHKDNTNQEQNHQACSNVLPRCNLS